MPRTKDPAAVRLGRRGAKRRIEVLDATRRSEIAKIAATARWKNRPKNLIAGRYKPGTDTAAIWKRLSDRLPWADVNLYAGLHRSKKPQGRLRWIRKHGQDPDKRNGQTHRWTLKGDRKRGTVQMFVQEL